MKISPDLRKVLLIVWMMIGLAVLLMIAVPFLFKEDAVLGNLPECSYKKLYGRECLFCGMTRSFYCISRGELGKASEFNRLGLYLYAAFAVNEACILIFILKLINNRWRLENAHH
ncbi:MAG TPA: hypothetical protein DET40_10365 [Lentisphaeria bacterium]|nr:MAG: hypothetical protein A2X45_09910 [Lentisphaerae bacterium GWF2_50_93]HCE43940.1 hypothetical protein [Lentisphaeria bacterium]